MKNTAAKDTGLAAHVAIVFILVAWLLFLVLALRVLGPDSVHTTFNSDSAIPILMANDERPITVFDTYYYAADRWGGWPLLIAKVVHRDTGLQWTDRRLHYVRTTWLFFGLLVLAALNARAAPAVIVSGVMALCIEPALRRRLFDLSQLYAWQLTALFLAWFCLRRLFAQRPRSDKATSARVNGIFWSSAFYFCAFFAIWSSVASAPMLSVLVILEALRSRFSFQNPITKRRIGLAVVLLLAATASERLMKINYHRYCLKHFGYDFKTPMAFDRGHLYENLFRNWDNLLKFSSFPLIAVALCFVVGIAGLILYTSIVGKASLRTRVVSFLEDETTMMIVALIAMAAMNFLIMVSVSHVRLSLNDDRFQTPAYIFGAISGLLTIYLAIRVFANRMAVTRYVLPLVLAGAFIFLAVEFPRRQLSESYARDRQTALALAQKAPPGSMLMGRYWETYKYAGLQPINTMTPLPLEGLQNRIPWTVEMLHDSQQVVLEYQHGGFVPTESLPPNELWQYGNLLRLQEAHFYENGEYAFALYVKDRGL
jgi:hypothetical protein